MFPTRKSTRSLYTYLKQVLKACFGFVVVVHILAVSSNQISWLCFWCGLLVQALCAISLRSFPYLKIASPLFLAICGKPIILNGFVQSAEAYPGCYRQFVWSTMGLVPHDPPRHFPNFLDGHLLQFHLRMAHAVLAGDALEAKPCRGA